MNESCSGDKGMKKKARITSITLFFCYFGVGESKKTIESV